MLLPKHETELTEVMNRLDCITLKESFRSDYATYDKIATGIVLLGMWLCAMVGQITFATSFISPFGYLTVLIGLLIMPRKNGVTWGAVGMAAVLTLAWGAYTYVSVQVLFDRDANVFREFLAGVELLRFRQATGIANLILAICAYGSIQLEAEDSVLDLDMIETALAGIAFVVFAVLWFVPAHWGIDLAKVALALIAGWFMMRIYRFAEIR